jgi:hypothetical protein
VKVLSHSGYDVMKLEVEETTWWRRLLRKGPVRDTYTGHNDRWRNSQEVLVKDKRRLELEKIWIDLREQARMHRDRARGRA